MWGKPHFGQAPLITDNSLTQCPVNTQKKQRGFEKQKIWGGFRALGSGTQGRGTITAFYFKARDQQFWHTREWL